MELACRLERACKLGLERAYRMERACILELDDKLGLGGLGHGQQHGCIQRNVHV